MNLSERVRIIKTGSIFALPVLIASVLLLLPLVTLKKHALLSALAAALLAELAAAPASSGSGTLPPGPFLRLSLESQDRPARIWVGAAAQKDRPVMAIRRGQDSYVSRLSHTAQLLFSDKPLLIQIVDQQAERRQTYLMRSEMLRAPLLEIALIYAACTAVLYVFAALFLGVGYYLRIEKPVREITVSIDQMGANPQMLRQIPAMPHAVWQLRRISARLEQMAVTFRRALRQKERLADAGEAVTKINHDLRNILSTATLVSEVLEQSEDPKIAEIGPVINSSVENASRLCQICSIS